MSSAGQLPRSRNFWYGTTVTRSADLDRIVYLPRKQHNQFISIEPVMEAIDIEDLTFMDWIIVGAETAAGEARRAEAGWIEAIVQTARAPEIPVMMKHSKEMEEIWGRN
jgi:protein gp37